MLFPNNVKAQQGMRSLGRVSSNFLKQKPPPKLIDKLIGYVNEKKLDQVIEQGGNLLIYYPKSAMLFNIVGVASAQLMRFDQAIGAFEQILKLKPDNANAHYNLGKVYQEKGLIRKAIDSYIKAVQLKPNYEEAYFNLGVVLQEQGKLDEAIDAYTKTLTINPDNDGAHINMGNAFRDYGNLQEAIDAYHKALVINPDLTAAYINMGNAFKDQNKLEDAIDAYKKALVIEPEASEAHLCLSSVCTYHSGMGQIRTVEALLARSDLKSSARCNLLYANAKMREDLGDLKSAFDSYVAGGLLRQKSLKYEFKQDEIVYDQIKQTAPIFKELTVRFNDDPNRVIPVFIVGMPRTGTTLAEQIISSHSEVTGAGELNYVSLFGENIASGQKAPTLETVAGFRDRYLGQISKRAGGKPFVTDKMPHNFRFIALICSALPEAKIIHIYRDAKATCWSNFKHYFASNGLGYSYNLNDTVKYYGLYKDLMNFWYQSYNDRIYNLDYDKLTEGQELETRRLIEFLGLNWEDACLAPQENSRPVRTASGQQVRNKIYTGSSQAWRKYRSYIGEVFNDLRWYCDPKTACLKAADK